MPSSTTLAAAHGTLISIALRLASFLLSQLTVRFVSAAALGKASVQLELLLSTALFVGREGFRLALTKEIGEDGSQTADGTNNASADAKDKRPRDRQKIVNVSWLTVPVGALLSIIALLMHLHRCNQESMNSEHDNTQNENAALLDYKIAGILYCLASFVESLSEPLVIRCLQQMDVTTKAKAEGAALVLKSVSCFGWLYLGAITDTTSFAVTAFGISQLVYALVFTSIIYQKGRKSKGGIQWPKKIKSSMATKSYTANGDAKQNTTIKDALPTSIIQNFDLHTLHLVLIFTLQGLFKHALTEADKIVLSALAGSYDQGVYALAASYGGLAARMLLQPMEENARLLFSRQGALVAQQHLTSNTSNGKVDEKDAKSTSKDLLKDLEDTYFFLIRVVLYIGLIFATIATNYTSVLLRLLAGSRWGSNVEASAALSAFCVYTAFLALNGTTEAFVYGVARSGNDVGKLGIAHAVVGCVFALIAPGLVRKHGAVGLVAANCISMGLRSMYSLYYARGYFAKMGSRRSSVVGILCRILPHAMVLGVFGASFVITRASNNMLYYGQIAAGGNWITAGAQHIGVGALCVVVTVALSLWLERDIRYALLKLVKRKGD